ncbi:HAD family phosphatase [Mucilaginibacter sp.]|uniref:HAD family hydrolase n=1 Tax=Mucilaginibacter sp. TaxID=1882438 RepID=UPI0026231754|nr:HAD family phosphatase [Mucilaginibacter sp.]
MIFDFDGVIGDTMFDNCMAWQSAFATYDIKIEPVDYYLLEGMGRFQIANFFIAKYNLDRNLAQNIVSLKEDYYHQHNKFTLFPEIAEIMELLTSRNIKKAIVTGASDQRLKKTLDPAIMDQLSAVITADDVINGKPDPEPYLKAVKKLGLLADECLIIENAKLGIQSAKGALCPCFAIETTLDESYLREADEVFANHVILLAKLKQIFGSYPKN